jgi:glutamate-1-semialdehyde aminotransferase
LDKLAKLLRGRYAVEHVTLCGGGTEALQLAIAGAAARTQNPVVALPAYCCYDVAKAVVEAGCGSPSTTLTRTRWRPTLLSERVLVAGSVPSSRHPSTESPFPGNR